MDTRLHPATTRIAHRSLQGLTNLPLTDGEEHRIAYPLADLLTKPGGALERQLALGEAFCVVDRDQGHAFGFARKDGYCGWLAENSLTLPAETPSHWVASTGTHLYEGPKVQRRIIAALPMGAMVLVRGQEAGWAELPSGFVPAGHLREIGQVLQDPVAVAESFLHAPYLWGGNSRAGLDCSGLVQMVHLACGIACPADCDLQEAMGQELAVAKPLRRGDLLFWRGHVALVVDEARLIHANGHSMSVAYEETAATIARIAVQGGGPVTHRRRL
jgi:cell wall-associated NlpC family hydrolase